MESLSPTRRNFIISGLSCAGLLLSPLEALAAKNKNHKSKNIPKKVKPVDKTLSLYNIHTGESAKVAYCCGGQYVSSELKRVNRILRDHRSGEIHAVDPKLLDLLHSLYHKLQPRQAFHVVCGYRSPKTNAAMRETSSGVAKNSLHTSGRAVDIYLPGQDVRNLFKTARAMKRGGAGYYSGSGFVHLDVGAVRSWIG